MKIGISRPLAAHMSMFGAEVFWGLMAPLGKDAMTHGIDGVTMVTFRLIGGAILFWLTSFFVPKPFTPFQWAGMYREEDFVEKAKVVKSEIRAQLNQRSIRYSWHEPDVTILEGFLARGDRRCSKVILRAYEKGAIYDAWSESFDYNIWKESFAETNTDIDFYTLRERSTDEILPWDFIDAGVTKKFLIHEWEQAKKETVTPNCRQKCSGCGAMRYGGGVCYEGKN